jgi:NhaP-type Na+/H+ or K+/H+ antiporter
MAVKPSDPQAVAPASGGMNWKTQSYLIGVIGGVLLGLLSAYLFVRATEENMTSDRPQKVKTMDLMKLTLALLALVRQIAELGTR